MKIGFIGVGTISTAIVNGLCFEGDKEHEIYLSPRNAEKGKILCQTYSNVTVCGSNQELLDKAEWIVLAVIPRNAKEILTPLKFNVKHSIISFMSDFPISKIEEIAGDAKRIIRVLPLPFAARRIGPVVIYPNDTEAAKIFSKVGNVVAIDDEDKMETLLAITGIMSAFYGLSWEIVKWGEKEGLSRKESVDYVSSFLEALCIQGRNSEGGDINRLADEYTPGGLNEMGLLKVRDDSQAYTPWIEALDAIMKRLKK